MTIPFFYDDLNDLVKEQKAAGILRPAYSYPPPDGTDWLELFCPTW